MTAAAEPGGGGAGRALLPAAPLLVWGLHFGAVYAAHALACERGLAEVQAVAGIGFVPALVAAATAGALAALLWLARPGLAALRATPAEGGETEPGFRAWFTAAASVIAALAVVFQATPALVLPAC